jgi:REase_DpnII-MboI
MSGQSQPVKTIIHQTVLSATPGGCEMQQIATVYIQGREFRVHAPPAAGGPAIEWLDHVSVVYTDPDGFGGDVEANPPASDLIRKLVKIELEKSPNVPSQHATTLTVSAVPQNIGAIELLCERFHAVVKQLRKRHDNRPTLDINDEYDVQDLLHALLRIFFKDVRHEEWTPSYAGKSSRMDFLVQSEQIVVEVKKARAGLSAKQLGDELIIDIARYKSHQSCKRLVCFVYDPDGLITNPAGIEADLNRTTDSLIVKVIIMPRE